MILTARLRERMLGLWGALAWRRQRGQRTRTLFEAAMLPEKPPPRSWPPIILKRPGRTKAQKERRRR